MHHAPEIADKVDYPIVIRRERNADLINAISNHPDVHDIVTRGGSQEVDWTPAVHGCVILSNGKDACMVFEQTSEERHWQVMTLYADTCRGRRALQTGLAMKEFMRPYADLIFGSIPNHLRHAIWFYQKMGGVKVEAVDSGDGIYTAQPGESLYEMRF